MVSVTIFVEGGGESKELRSRCREGFSKLIKKMGFAGRMPRIVACGGRQSAYDMFNTAVMSAVDDEYPIILVDSEDPISSENPLGRISPPGEQFRGKIQAKAPRSAQICYG